MINSYIIVPNMAYRILSDDTGLISGKSYNFKLSINNSESLETILIDGSDKIYYYDLLRMLNRKLSHYGVHVKLNNGLSFEIDGKSINVTDVNLFGTLL